ncbi:SPOR domain-containing protein [Sulfitobacter sabulilitoris]|uniref:SPOR domain-containing protein n=1 Tax=Sulfitobacter sabulilitoris TaxID=2562655 RepID=UPI001FE9AE52|nr:SPOR domain-containing protein [Sulfitobacter sabulilitoris]
MAGAVISIGLIAGIGIWGYKLLVRDVSGIPVVRAAAGDMRVRPDDPGGQLARHQGLAVNAVAADGMAEKPADRLVLAPRALDLTEEDQPVSVAPVQQPDALVPAAQAVEAPDPAGSETATATPQAASIEALVAELTAGVAPIDTGDDTSAGPSGPTAQPLDPAPEEGSVIAALDAPGVRQSKRPRLRPADAPAVVVKASLPLSSAAAPVTEVDPASVAAGTRLVQLGAYDSPEVAREQWDKINARFGPYFEGKARIVQRANSGGRVFFRLRAMGFDDLSDARRFCSALVAENADCIPLVTR